MSVREFPGHVFFPQEKLNIVKWLKEYLNHSLRATMYPGVLTWRMVEDVAGSEKKVELSWKGAM